MSPGFLLPMHTPVPLTTETAILAGNVCDWAATLTCVPISAFGFRGQQR